MNEKELDKILNEYLSEFYSFFPKKCFNSRGYIDSNFHINLSENNINFKETQYFYSGEKKFVHWTSVRNLMSIINNREIRFYNLHMSSDSQEFNYAASKLPIDDEKIDIYKKYFYTFSFCEACEINNSNLWENYGNNYQGVAFEFEIVNDSEMWEKFMLSKVFYELPQSLIKLQDKLSELKTQHSNINFDFARLIGFHKEPKFSKEKEIRISTFLPFGDSNDAYWKYCKTDFRFEKNRPRITEYFGLNLWVNNNSAYLRSSEKNFDRKLNVEENYFITKPKIKITKIFFGKNCGISNKDFEPYYIALNQILSRQFGYDIEVSLNFI